MSTGAPSIAVTQVIPRGCWAHTAMNPSSSAACALCNKKVYEVGPPEYTGNVSIHTECGAVMHIECAKKLPHPSSNKPLAGQCPLCQKPYHPGGPRTTELNIWRCP